MADTPRYLWQLGLDPLLVGCAAANCRRCFAPQEAFAMVTMVGGEGTTAFFCSADCFLNGIPADHCARA